MAGAPPAALSAWNDVFLSGLHRRWSLDVMSRTHCENTLKRVKAIYKTMIGELQEQVWAELNVACEDEEELCFNTRKGLNHISVYLDSIENSMASATMFDKVAQIQTKLYFRMEEPTDLLIEIGFWSLRVADPLEMTEQTPVADFTSVPAKLVFRGLREQAKKGTYLSDTNSAHTIGSSLLK